MVWSDFSGTIDDETFPELFTQLMYLELNQILFMSSATFEWQILEKLKCCLGSFEKLEDLGIIRMSIRCIDCVYFSLEISSRVLVVLTVRSFVTTTYHARIINFSIHCIASINTSCSYVEATFEFVLAKA